MTESVVWRGGRIFSAADPGATALLVRDGRIGWLGADADAPAADRVVDLGGALVLPAFVDAHVHLTDTGLAVGGLDLSGVRSARELLDAVAAFAAARPSDAVVHGHGWDESTWADRVPPTAGQLDRAAGGRRVYLSQASVHSALCSSALLAAAQVSSADGWVREHDHHAVRAIALGSLSAAQRAAAQRTALAAAARRGIAAVHECGGPGTSSEADFASALGLSGRGLPEVYGYWGELGGAARARELGAVGAAGDLYADGALGSRTAALSSPYVDGATCGEAFVTAEQAAAHLVDCVTVGVQGGFHAIGDAAIGTVLDGFALAARRVGVERLRAGRHRVEHVELADRAMIARMVGFGVVASVQPAFDRLWGGAGRMYEQRLGLARSLASNPLGQLHAVGVALAFGSDSPVTPVDPWGAVAAAAQHRNPASRMGVRAAFAAHTRGGWRAVGNDVDGALVPGAAATFAVWETPAGVLNGLPVVTAVADGPAPPLPVCRATVLRGSTIFEGEADMGKLGLDPAVVARARALAARAGQPVVDLARSHTTVSVERAVLRLAGVAGADPDGIPWVNRLVDAVAAEVGLGHGVALPVFDALAREGVPDVTVLAQKAAAGSARFRVPSGRDAAAARRAAARATAAGLKVIDRRRAERDRLIRRYGDPPRRPWIYLIVATGDIMEDIPQAQAAARAGADVIAVIRSTGQSLLDYVPEGATREGFAGTYATQENFRLMRAALDETSRELGRYVRLTNYASGLCMPEIATLAGLERLDMMLNDSMYGILFRDINPVRTFVDQRFSRQVHARAGIVINTGEDNYLTTADAVEAAHTVTVSQLLNEFFAHEAGLADWQLGLGHAFEINPDLPESLRLELAHALLARELFPDAPLKWMPPTKHMTGDVFRGNLLDGFFNLVGALTGQGILLVGMMTEAVVTPWLSDRDIALQNVRYVLGAAGGLHEDFVPAPGGFIQRRAHRVLAEAVELLERIVDDTLLAAIADGTFGIMKRPADRGRGLDGVAAHEDGYFNPVTAALEAA